MGVVKAGHWTEICHVLRKFAGINLWQSIRLSIVMVGFTGCLCSSGRGCSAGRYDILLCSKAGNIAKKFSLSPNLNHHNLVLLMIA